MMTEHDDLIDKARKAARAVYLAADRAVADDLSRILTGLADALEACPSLVVRGEEELAKGLFRLNYTADSYNMYGWHAAVSMTREHYMARARALIASGTVRVAPSLVTASREALASTKVPILDSSQKAHMVDLGYEVADALLAPGGPVRLADATPEQAWDEGYGVGARFLPRDTNPYDGFTRKETNE